MSGSTALPTSFYDRPVVDVAQDLLGCVVRHGETAGRIVETEAYHHSEPACHAYVGLTAADTRPVRAARDRLRLPLLRHPRPAERGLRARGRGAAVLIRALEPTRGHRPDARAARPRARARSLLRPGQADPGARNRARAERHPARRRHRVSRTRPRRAVAASVAGERIGITRAVELPWRFCDVGQPPRLAAGAAPRGARLLRRRGAAAAAWRGRRRRSGGRRGRGRRASGPASAWARARPARVAGRRGAAARFVVAVSGVAASGRRAPPASGVVGEVGDSARRCRSSVVVAVLVLARLALGARWSRIPIQASHQVVPDLGRERAAGDRAAVVLGLHRLRAGPGSRPRPRPSGRLLKPTNQASP